MICYDVASNDMMLYNMMLFVWMYYHFYIILHTYLYIFVRFVSFLLLSYVCACGDAFIYFPLLFTALFKLGLRFNFALKRNCCVVESVFIAVVVIEMTLIMMIVIE